MSEERIKTRGRFGNPDLGLPLVARKPFIYNGNRFEAGDAFDWRRRAIPHRKVVQLLNSGYVAHEGDPRRDPNVGAGATAAKATPAAGSRQGKALRQEGAAAEEKAAKAKPKKVAVKKAAKATPAPAAAE